MKKQKPTAHADGVRHSRRGKEAQPHDAQSPEQKQERKDRVLTEGASSMVRDIGDASAGTGYPDDGWPWQRLVRFTLERKLLEG